MLHMNTNFKCYLKSIVAAIVYISLVSLIPSNSYADIFSDIANVSKKIQDVSDVINSNKDKKEVELQQFPSNNKHTEKSISVQEENSTRKGENSTASPVIKLDKSQIDQLLAKGEEAFKSNDYSKAQSFFEPIASNGNAFAQYRMGGTYLYGIGANKSASKAKFWLEKAGVQDGKNKGVSDAQALLAEMFKFGNGDVKKDLDAHFRWAEKSAANNNLRGMALLGEAYYYGDGVEKNKEKGSELIKAAADKGSGTAKQFIDVQKETNAAKNMPDVTTYKLIAGCKSMNLNSSIDMAARLMSEVSKPRNFVIVMEAYNKYCVPLKEKPPFALTKAIHESNWGHTSGKAQIISNSNGISTWVVTNDEWAFGIIRYK